MGRRILAPNGAQTHRTIKAANAVRDALSRRFPARTYEVHVVPGGRYYVACTAGAPSLQDRLAELRARKVAR
jgi:hypothetical protein